MLNRTEIKSMTYAPTYSKGLDLYRSSKVLNMSVEGDDPEYITAQVQGSGRMVYEAELTYNTLLDDIEYAWCECPSYRSYDGLCKHCVAVLLNYIDHKKLQQYYQNDLTKTGDSLKSLQGMKVKKVPALKPRPKFMTTPVMKQLLTKQQLKNTLPFIQEELYGKVHLEPYLTCPANGSAQMEFKIGISHMYILKDVFYAEHVLRLCRWLRNSAVQTSFHAFEGRGSGSVFGNVRRRPNHSGYQWQGDGNLAGYLRCQKRNWNRFRIF